MAINENTYELNLLQVERNDNVGRYALAKCDLSPGDVILAETPFAFGPKTDTRPLCLGCYTPITAPTFCSSCGWPVCNSTCELIPAHKNAECFVFAGAKARFQKIDDFANSSLQYECIVPLRVLLAKEAFPDRWEREVKEMEAHNDASKSNAIWRFNQINIVNYLRGPCKLADKFSEELIHRVCGILQANAFESRSISGYPIRCLFPKYAILSHNCISNVSHSILCTGLGNENDFRIIVRAATDISKGKELFSSYTYSLWPTMTRREHLRESKYFDCHCTRCSDPEEMGTHMSTLKCRVCLNGHVTSVNSLDANSNWICSNCNHSQTGEMIKQLFNTLQKEIDDANNLPIDECVKQLENILAKCKQLLHPSNAFCCIIRSHLISIYGIIMARLKNNCPITLIEKFTEYCKQLLLVLNIVEPGYTRIRGITLYELSKALTHLTEQHNYQQSNLQQIVEILQESIAILNLEPVSTREGRMAITARNNLQELQEKCEGIIETNVN